MDDAINLSVDIPWKIIEMDCKEESNDMEQEVESMAEPPKTLLICKKM